MKRSRKYQDELIESLKDKNEALAYLNAAWEECFNGDKESMTLFLLALRNVAEAQGGVSNLAKKTHLRREQIYHTLSSDGNPELKTFMTLLRGLNLIPQFV
ncbi:MAG: transcriptional regulator [Chlamydiota bacterium]